MDLDAGPRPPVSRWDYVYGVAAWAHSSLIKVRAHARAYAGSWRREPHRLRRLGRGTVHFFDLWINEKNRVPAMLIGAALIIATGPILHLSAFTVLGLNWGSGKIPEAWSAVQAVRKRSFDRWSRPQWWWHKATPEEREQIADWADGAADPDKPLNGWARLCQRSRVARFVDEWLNERSRVPHTVLEYTTLGIGIFGLHLSWLSFVLEGVLGQIPPGRSVYKAIRHGNWKRLAQSQSFGRTDLDGKSPEGTEMREVGVASRTMSLPQPAQPRAPERPAPPRLELGGASRPAAREPLSL